MPATRIEQLKIPPLPRHRADTRWWREWCFARVLLRTFGLRLLLVALVLAGGTVAFYTLHAPVKYDFWRSLYFTWLLIFGQPPDTFPRDSAVLRVIFFLAPLVGLLIVIETIVEFALTLRDRRRSERTWCVVMAQSMSDHIVLVGMGRLGYRTYRLLRRLNQAVVVIERQADDQFLDVVRTDGSPLLFAVARRDTVLAEANVASARSIICATNDDLTNLEVALDARRINPKIRVVLRMFDQTMADKVREGFNIRTAMSQAALSAPAFAMAAMDPSIANTFAVDDELLIMQRWSIRPESPLLGRAVGDLLNDYRFCTVRRQRAGAGTAELFPSATTRFEAGDELVVQGTFAALVELRRRGLALAQVTLQTGAKGRESGM